MVSQAGRKGIIWFLFSTPFDISPAVFRYPSALHAVLRRCSLSFAVFRCFSTVPLLEQSTPGTIVPLHPQQKRIRTRFNSHPCKLSFCRIMKCPAADQPAAGTPTNWEMCFTRFSENLLHCKSAMLNLCSSYRSAEGIHAFHPCRPVQPLRAFEYF